MSVEVLRSSSDRGFPEGVKQWKKSVRVGRQCAEQIDCCVRKCQNRVLDVFQARTL
jgi:hypothetical protein